MKNKEQLILDAVITWVDGNDPSHKAKRELYLDNKKELNNKNARMRYGQVNEIEFVVKSILKYAKFVRNIFIVTDNQTPDFLKDENFAKKNFPKVSIVDHKIIFKGHEHFLPTFNSRAIESLLYKIPNLSEHFLYFNDDFFLINETRTTDFFSGKKPVLRGVWTSFYEDIWYKKITSFLTKMTSKEDIDKSYGYKKAQQTIARILGFSNYLRLDHTASALRISTFKNHYSKDPELLERNLKHRFRHPETYLSQSFANHLEIKSNNYVLKKDYQLVYFQNLSYPLFWIKQKLNNGAKNKNKLFLCVQSLDQSPKGTLNYIKNWLEKRYN
jgi:hypothetical protein